MSLAISAHIFVAAVEIVLSLEQFHTLVMYIRNDKADFRQVVLLYILGQIYLIAVAAVKMRHLKPNRPHRDSNLL